MTRLQTFGLTVATLLALLATFRSADAAQPAPKPQHVFIIVLENEGYDVTFGAKSPAAYLKALAKQGVQLEKYYGIGHFSLDNYIAMVSGQSPNPITQADCQAFVDFVLTKPDPDAEGQAIGKGCVYPKSVSTIANQLQDKGLTWKGYMEDMGNIPERESVTCGHPEIGLPDNTQHAVVGDQYATRHNPFMYFHSIIDDATNCAAHVVNLRALSADLLDERTTPNYVFITPNLCHDGHDPSGSAKNCINGEPGGLVSADQFLADTVPKILASPAFKHDGLLIITFDEADIDIDYDKTTGKNIIKKGDVSSCCDEKQPPNIDKDSRVVFGQDDYYLDQGAGIAGAGGGLIGAVLLSPYIEPGLKSQVEYNHYSMLRSIEDFFGLGTLGYAGQKGLNMFGRDSFWKAGR